MGHKVDGIFEGVIHQNQFCKIAYSKNTCRIAVISSVTGIRTQLKIQRSNSAMKVYNYA